MDFAELASSVATSIDDATAYLSAHYGFVFDGIGSVITGVNDPLAAALTSLPAWAVIAAVGLCHKARHPLLHRIARSASSARSSPTSSESSPTTVTSGRSAACSAIPLAPETTIGRS